MVNFHRFAGLLLALTFSRPEALFANGDGASVVPSPFEQRLLHDSRRFVGKGYRLSPLGEAGGPDADPLIRFDAFDCTTYIETLIALARNPADPKAEILRIRYRDGIPDFSRRRHLPEFQWLSELSETGVLRDITRETAPGETILLPVAMSPSIWAARNKRFLPHLPASAVPAKRIELPYVPLGVFPRIALQIQEVAVLSVVRRGSSGVPVHISHQALLIPRAGSLLVRHARPGQVNRVVEEDLARFLARLKRQTRRPVLGLNIADITDPG
ncbi:MAG: hypothetical protein A2286_14385 [Gammaproteobacteria bacterium RIFOXYA12_FULL_61_12]|nr:MAG: hypothetical protein A2286_14385 [Gammaproteobacteria bacterium RIFOXYA12_FULL_61_12]